jgi:cold shock CspA family protein
MNSPRLLTSLEQVTTRRYSEGMFYGIVQRVIFEKGFGFIRPDRGPDVFFPASAVQDGRFDFIQPEQPVKYELEKLTDEEKKAARGPRAKIVVLLDRMPGGILEDPPQTMRAKHHPKSKGRKATWKRKIDLSAPMEKPLPEIRPIEPLVEQEAVGEMRDADETLDAGGAGAGHEAPKEGASKDEAPKE